LGSKKAERKSMGKKENDWNESRSGKKAADGTNKAVEICLQRMGLEERRYAGVQRGRGGE